MTIEQVVQVGAKIQSEGRNDHLALIFFVIACAAILLACIMLRDVNGPNRKILISAFFFVAAFIFIGICIAFIQESHHPNPKTYADRVEKWKQDTVLPYLAKEDKEVVEITYIKTSEATTLEERVLLRQAAANLGTYEVGYRVGRELKTEIGMHPIYFDVAEGEKPFLQFLRIPVDLGHGIDAGLYDVEIHLPRTNFTNYP